MFYPVQMTWQLDTVGRALFGNIKQNFVLFLQLFVR